MGREGSVRSRCQPPASATRTPGPSYAAQRPQLPVILTARLSHPTGSVLSLPVATNSYNPYNDPMASVVSLCRPGLHEAPGWVTGPECPPPWLERRDLNLEPWLRARFLLPSRLLHHSALATTLHPPTHIPARPRYVHWALPATGRPPSTEQDPCSLGAHPVVSDHHGPLRL